MRLQNKLLDKGSVARVVCPNQPFDSASSDVGSVVPIIDICLHRRFDSARFRSISGLPSWSGG